MKRALIALLVIGCRGSSVDKERATEMFTRVPLATAPGLSGLATDADGALWTISERGRRAYRITLDAADRPTLETFGVEGELKDVDLEAIAALGGGRFALGTEGKVTGLATVLLAERRDATLVITDDIVLSNADVGIEMAANHGAEGLCGAGDTIVVAIEGAGGTGPDARWAPIVRIASGKIVRTQRLALTTATGKISGLDCTVAPDGTISAWAIERHFEVSKIVTFTIPPFGQGPEMLTPTVMLDLGTVLNSRLNLEGIAKLPDGRLVAIVDNQWKTLDGNSELLVFRALSR